MALTWNDLKAGKRYRVNTTYRGGATTSFEGRIDDIIRTGTQNTLVHWVERGPTLTIAKVTDDADDGVIGISFYPLAEPLPTTPGSVISHLVDEFEREALVLIGDRWLEVGTGRTPRLINDPDWVLLYKPAQK